MSRAPALSPAPQARPPAAPPDAAPSGLCFGVAALDAAIGSAAALHEFYPAAPDDNTLALSLALLLAARSPRPGAVLWVMEARSARGVRPYAPGLAALGVAPERLVVVRAPDVLGLLRAAADAVACPALAAVVIACPHAAPAFDLTASRRLALAAARSGVSVLAVRGGPVVPSAAQTRWAVRRRSSVPRAASAPGHPAFGLELLRNRTGPIGLSIDMEWNADAKRFDPTAAGNHAAMAAERTSAVSAAVAA